MYKNILLMASLKILIVDDEFGIREGIKRILRKHSSSFPFIEEDFDFELSEAEDGLLALEKIKKNNYDIILLDNKLPGMEGIEILSKIRELKKEASVMMITSYASLELAVEATQKGAYNFVPKPFTPEELRTAIDDLVKHLYLKRMTRNLSKEGRQIRFQFLSVLSHELKSPLNAIEGYLRIMQDKQAGDKIENYDTMINRSMERINGMRGLIMDLLDLTRIQSGEKKRELKKIDLVDIARQAVATIEPLAIQKNIKLDIQLPEMLYMKADSTELEIIFNNLLSNGIKYNKDYGDLKFCITENNHKILIEVEDSGIGMSEDEQAMLFKEFVRIKNAQTRKISGSGLGLSIVKKIVDLYNGDILVESESGKGTKFMIELPV